MANIIGVETKSGLYDQLGIVPPDTGREDDGTDAMPKPMSNFDPFTGFIMNPPPPPQSNAFRIQIQNDDAANEPKDDAANGPKADLANEPDGNENVADIK